MSDVVEITLPYPPSVNHYLSRNQRGGVRVKPEVKSFYWQVFLACQGKAKFGGRVAIEVDVWFPDNRKRDLGNLDKCLLDALVNAGVIMDDAWQMLPDVHWRAKGIIKGGQVVVKIKEYCDEL